MDKNDKLSQFKTKLDSYKMEINNVLDKDESEEHFKSIFNDFFKNAYNYDVNTHKRIDSVIKIDDGIKVVIEVKRPQNTNEYISDTNINTKAFHEILLYYYELRQSNINTVNNIIITDCQTIYLFSAKDIETIIDNKKISKLLNGYKNKELSIINTTSDFYNEVSKLINELDISLNAYKIDLFDDKLDIESLYRVLDKHSLLGVPIKNKDHNVLNKDFYNELLYIMGLHETIDSGIPIIKPLTLDSTNNHSLMSMIINKIDSTGIDTKLWLSLGETDEERTESMALELVLTWINRILFLKLLEAQLIKYHTEDKEKYKFLDFRQLNNWSEVNTLFFDILAKPINTRERKEIPYLNSSLFEPTSLEFYVPISKLNINNKLDIYSSTVLKETTPRSVLQYLLEFLDCYNFGTGDSNLSESKRLINASVLGLIFEKLNGYKDGAVYTPSFITMSMSRESLRHTIVSKFNEVYKWNCQHLMDLKNKIIQLEIPLLEVNQVFNTIRICDPAVGSGHFLVSILNELLLIKYELKILCDKSGAIISHCDMNIQYDELFLQYNGQDFSYQVDSKNKALSTEIQTLQETLFHEKETLIENCLFGVDINPKSSYICQLRLWIELLKNTYYIQDDKEIVNLQTLPNIDINIKTGNSLVSRFPLKQDFSLIINALKTKNISMDRYKELVLLYKNAHDKAEKHKVHQEIQHIKDMLKKYFLTNDPEYDKNLKEYNKYQSEFENLDNEIFNVDTARLEKVTDLRNKAKAKLEKSDDFYKHSLEWRYEFPEVLDDEGNFLGFDLMIGNPPYFRYGKMKTPFYMQQSNYLRTQAMYKPACIGEINAYEVFLLLSYELCKPNGYITEIFQNSFLADKASGGVRKFYLNSTNILHINAFPNDTDKYKRVFDNVSISVMTLLAQKKDKTKSFTLDIYPDRMETAPKKLTVDIELIRTIDSEGMEIPNLNEQELLIFAKCYQDNTIFKNFINISQGELHLTSCKKYFSDNPKHTPFLTGANIQKYYITDTPKHRNVPLYFDKELYLKEKPKRKSHIENPRLAYQDIVNISLKYRLIASLVPANIGLGNSVNYMVLKEDTNINCHFILGLINSWLLNWLFKARSTNAHTIVSQIERLPIPTATPEQQAPIIDLVQQCITAKAKDKKADISLLQKQIDELVYNLYGLTAEEIDVVEGR